jgi:hypothetical protein
MSWTKRDIVNQAFEEVGLASFVYDMNADQIQSALRRLDAMMGVWALKGINLGFPITTGANSSDPDTDTNLPVFALEAVYLNLGIKIAPAFGKTVAQELKASAKQSYDALLVKAAFPNEQQITGLPLGAGSKYLKEPFLPQANYDPLQNTNNDQLIFNG